MILDTTFLIDLMQNDEAAVKRKKLQDRSEEIYRVATPTIFELWGGISQTKNPSSREIQSVNCFITIGYNKANSANR